MIKIVAMPWSGCSSFRSSHRKLYIKIGVLKNFAKFTGKHLCQSIFFNKVAGLNPATLLKKSLCHWCFPANFEKFLRPLFLQNGRLLVQFHKTLIYHNFTQHFERLCKFVTRSYFAKVLVKLWIIWPGLMYEVSLTVANNTSAFSNEVKIVR